MKISARQWLMIIITIAIACLIPKFASYSSEKIFASNNGTWAVASNLVNGKGYSGCSTDYFPLCNPANQSTAMREPIPVLLMAMAILIYPSKFAGLIIQSLLYLGTIPVIYLILKNNGSNAFTALLAAFLWTVSIPVLGQVDNDSGALAAAFFFSLGLLFFLKDHKGSGIKNLAFSGLFMGLASLSRTVFLGISIGLGVILLLKKLIDTSADSRKQVNSALSFLAVIVLVVAPWILRNYIVFGMPVIGSSLTGYNVFRMNFIIAGDNYFPHYVGPTEAYTAIMQLLQKSNLTGIENEAQMQSIYMKAGLQIIAQHPLQYLGLSLYRFIVLWFNTSVNEAYNMKYILSDYAAIAQQTLLLFGVMFSAVRSLEKNWALIVSLLLGCGAYMAIDAQLRYLVDLMPVIVILSALSVANLQFIFKQQNNAIPQLGNQR